MYIIVNQNSKGRIFVIFCVDVPKGSLNNFHFPLEMPLWIEPWSISSFGNVKSLFTSPQVCIFLWYDQYSTILKLIWAFWKLGTLKMQCQICSFMKRRSRLLMPFWALTKLALWKYVKSCSFMKTTNTYTTEVTRKMYDWKRRKTFFWVAESHSNPVVKFLTKNILQTS